MIVDVRIAKEIILAHAGHSENADARSIIGSLRPFVGISEVDFRDFMFSLICLKEHLSADRLDRDLIYGLWDFCSQLRVLSALITNNKIITIREAEVLAAWGSCVDSFCRRSFRRLDLGKCLFTFLEYLSSDLCSSPQIYKDLDLLLEDLKVDADFEVAPAIEKAIFAISQ